MGEREMLRRLRMICETCNAHGWDPEKGHYGCAFRAIDNDYCPEYEKLRDGIIEMFKNKRRKQNER